MVQASWAEIVSCVGVMEKCMTDQEAYDVAEIIDTESKIEEMCHRRVTDARAIVKAMTDQVVQHEREVVVPSEEGFASQVAGVEQERARMVSHIEGLREVAVKTEGDIELLREKAKRVDEAMEGTVEAHLTNMPRVQNSISLYANITDIKWNYEADPGMVAGWFMPKGSDTVQGFQFSATGRSEFEVANKLWDIIDGRARAMVEA
ncbi:unnamed protein product [Choristocarpus tenellus]